MAIFADDAIHGYVSADCFETVSIPWRAMPMKHPSDEGRSNLLCKVAPRMSTLADGTACDYLAICCERVHLSFCLVSSQITWPHLLSEMAMLSARSQLD